jgi:hypothetical protein
MNDRPNATELLDIARTTLISAVLPRLPEDQRYNALMIANAMAISAREHAQGPEVPLAELARLRALFNENDDSGVGALPAALERYNRRLVADIRTGQFDAEKRTALVEHLQKTVDAKVAVTNPKILKA